MIWEDSSMIWEKCLRATRCRRCGKLMVKGEDRLKERVRDGYYKQNWFFCVECGQDFLKKEDEPIYKRIQKGRFPSPLLVDLPRKDAERRKGRRMLRLQIGDENEEV